MCPEAEKIEMVYDLHGKLRVTILVWADQHTRGETLRGVRTIGKKKYAYEQRTIAESGLVVAFEW